MTTGSQLVHSWTQLGTMYVEGGAPLNPMNLLAPSDMVKNLYSVPVSTGFISDLAKYTYLNFDATASPQVPFHGPATSSSYEFVHGLARREKMDATATSTTPHQWRCEYSATQKWVIE